MVVADVRQHRRELNDRLRVHLASGRGVPPYPPKAPSLPVLAKKPRPSPGEAFRCAANAQIKPSARDRLACVRGLSATKYLRTNGADDERLSASARTIL